MIISHKYKFIFIKPSKVGGTSIEIALARHCGDKDIITPFKTYNPEADEDKYLHTAKNYKDKEFFQHITPNEIKKKIGNKIWKNYFKFTIVRNPWDQTVSRYWWKRYRDRRKILQEGKITIRKVILNLFNPGAYKLVIGKILEHKNFNYFASSFSKTYPNKYWKNSLYYFDEKGKPVCDFYIRYENLQKDYEKVCKRLGIPYKKLPRTKNKSRKDKKHYSLYYNNETKKIIHNLFKKEIDYFGYKFERK